MKQTGTCPKCGGTDVYANDTVTKRGDRAVMAGAKGTHRMYIQAYVCLNCGFIEEHLAAETLADEKKITALRRAWRKVGKG